MARILFLAHRIPYPPNKGDKIRSWHFLERLLEEHEVHLAFYVDQPKDLVHIPFLQAKVKSLCYRCVSRLSQLTGAFLGLLTGRPMTLAAYPKRKLKSYVDDLFANEQIDMVFLFSGAVAPLIENKPDHIPVVADLVDVDSDKWAAYAQNHRFPLSWVYRREAKLLSAYELAVADAVAETTFVSDAEAALFRSKLPIGSKASVGHINNGVDLEAFNPARFVNVPVAPNSVIFTGAMDYQPNIEAVEWFVAAIWPAVRGRVPDARFVIAGAPVHARVEALADEQEGISVLGFVEDMAETIAASGVVVAPLCTARGVQNKVLEGMAMAKAVVATPAAKEGIEAEAGVHLMVADGADAVAEDIVTLLREPEKAVQLGAAARAHIEKCYSWATSLGALDVLVLESLRKKDH